MDYILIILLKFIPAIVSESPFACDSSTVRPGNGLPYYQIIDDLSTFKTAEEVCRTKGAELYTIREDVPMIELSSVYPTVFSGFWLSAKRRYWLHDSLNLGLAFESWAAGHPNNAGGNCAYVDQSQSTTELYSAPCSTEYNVVCTSPNLGSCNPEYIFDYVCYFIPEDDSAKPFFEASRACEKQSGYLTAIYNQHQMDWIASTFRNPFWTGYKYNGSSDDMFWYNGRRVTNSNFQEGDFRNKGDCVIIKDDGTWQKEDCDIPNAFICILEIPYARVNTTCNQFADECVCYWTGSNAMSFNHAMEYCMSNGGTMAYPSNQERLSRLSSIINTTPYWVGISDGNTEGVYRGTDASAVTWMTWTYGYGPYANAGYDCIERSSSGFNSQFCGKQLAFACQSLPDAYLYGCNQESGCLRTQDFWDVENIEQAYTGTSELTIRNVQSFDKCWDFCVNYIAFLCLIITYNTESKECLLSSTISEDWNQDTSLLSRKRTRRVLDPDSYCLEEVSSSQTLYNAEQTCANYKTGWKIPVVSDLTMMERIGSNTWISARDTDSLPRVFKTLEDDYLPYSNWSNSQPASSYARCVYISNNEMYTADCGTGKRVKCLAKTEDVCLSSPNITHGNKLINATSGDVLYTCEEGYFMPTLNVSSLIINCSCDWLTNLERLENCTAIQCPVPEDNSLGTVVNMTGLAVNETVTCKCPLGYVVSETGSIYYSLTCTYVPGSTTAIWSTIPDLQALNCSDISPLGNASYSAEDKMLGSLVTVTCNDWYWIPLLSTNETNTTCVTDYSGLFATWCWIPKCEEIICPTPTTVPNATYILQERKVVYTCEANHRIRDSRSNTSEVSCQYDDNFTAFWLTVPSCEAITCSETPTVQRASVITDAKDNYTGAVITYQCSDGFVAYEDENQLNYTKQFNMTCVTDYNTFTAKWIGSYSCDVPKCEYPPERPNSVLTVTNLTVGSVANYTCELNYTVYSSGALWTISTCVFRENESNAYWTEPDNCSAVRCSEPPAVLHSKVTTKGYDLGDTAVYTCDEQYTASGDGNLSSTRQSWQSRCVLDDNNITQALWTPVKTCIESPTTLLSTLPSTAVSESPPAITEPNINYDVPLIRQCSLPAKSLMVAADSTELFLSSKLSYVTLPGYYFSEGGKARSSVCLKGGQWSGQVLDVRRYRCPSLPHVSGATKSTNDNYVGTQVEIRCTNPKAKMENGLSVVTIRCTYNQQWTFVPTMCKPQKCGPFEVVEHSHLLAFNNSIGGRATIRCNRSYRFADGTQTKSFRCLPNLSWEPSEKCLLRVCEQLRVPENGQISTEIALEGTLVEVACLAGFRFPDEDRTKLITCNSSFLWSNLANDCEEIRCPDPPEISNGNRTPANTLYNTNITYTCDGTYRLEYGYRQMTIRCGENGEWTYSNLSCESNRCPPVPNVINAVPSTLLAVSGTTVTYTCYDGYIFPHNEISASVSCNGEVWSMEPTGCLKVTCPELNLSHAIWFGNGRSYGDIVTLVCEKGYIYNNNNSTGVLECQANSEWSGDTRGCVPIKCEPPPDVTYSTRNVPSSNDYGTNITYECLINYWFRRGIRTASITCTELGRWSEPPGRCIPIACPPVPVWEDMEANTTVNTVGTTIYVNCMRDGLNHSIVSICTADGEWQPPLDRCQAEGMGVFEPEPEEASGAGSIGLVVTAIIALFSIVLAISDGPLIIAAIKGQPSWRKDRNISRYQRKRALNRL